MTEVIRAVYERGLLRPLRPLDLRERQTVRIQVLVDETPDAGSVGEAARIMIAGGLMQPKPAGPIPPDPVSAEERQRLADLMGIAPGKPLSEIILDERGDW